jgi:hypothetical protein
VGFLSPIMHTLRQSEESKQGNAMQRKQFVPKYAVDLSRGLFGFCHLAIFVSCSVVCHLKQIPLQRSILKVDEPMGGIYILASSPPPPTHRSKFDAPALLVDSPSLLPLTSFLATWPTTHHMFPTPDRNSSLLPTLPFVCFCFRLIPFHFLLPPPINRYP